MKALNRWNGVMKALQGLGGVTAALCFLALGWWLALPFGALGGLALGQGVVQVVTGWADDEV